MNFGNLLRFLRLNKVENEFLIMRTVSGPIHPRLQPTGHGGMLCVAG
jgi:hypothetical protein